VIQTTMWKRLQSWLCDPVDAFPVRMFEVVFVSAFVVRMVRNFANWREWLTAEGFRPTAEEYASMGYPAPLPVLEPWLVLVLAFLLFGSAVLVLLNRWRRVALWVLLGTAFWVQGVDYMGSFAYNKIYIAHFALLATGPGYFRGADGRLMVSGALLRMLQLSIVTIYFAAGIAKAFHGDWLKYGNVLWTHAQGFHRTELAAWMLRNVPVWGWTAMQHTSLYFELLAPLLFFWGRTRWAAICFGILFHLMIALLMNGLIFFTLQMWAFYALFLRPEEFRFVIQCFGAWFDRLRSERPSV
jgi:hypothetical protein